MGFGDPYHPHPLKIHLPGANHWNYYCFRCELQLDFIDWCYECNICPRYYIHKLCAELPQSMRHPLHPQHSLTFSPPTRPEISTNAICDKCHNPCLGGDYTYTCLTCLNFNLHLKCFLTLNLEEKHWHPLRLCEVGFSKEVDITCGICGLRIDDGLSFVCKDCDFYIHFECTFLPQTVKGHHCHELTYEYRYPQDSKVNVCDVCEYWEGEDLDRGFSYYYCRKCDYIAHVRCVTTKPDRPNTHFDVSIHEHPLIYSIEYTTEGTGNAKCAACKRDVYGFFYRCCQCNFIVHKSCAAFPRFIKHPRHKDHILALLSYVDRPVDPDDKLAVCSLCHNQLSDGAPVLQCTDCTYAEHLKCAASFSHPFFKYEPLFFTTKGTMFRCNACGELGDGYRMSCGQRYASKHIDLHLECFALPGKIDHGCHLHPLFLVSSTDEIASDNKSYFCDVCGTIVDRNQWIYYCKQCKYITHLKCGVSDLLSDLRASNHCSNLCTITQSDKESFVEIRPNHCMQLSVTRSSSSTWPALDQEDLSDDRGLDELTNDAVQCPECQKPISVQAHSDFTNFKSHYTENKIISVYDQPREVHQEYFEQICCPVCCQLIFPPTYSCAECGIFFHKSCAEIPRKHTGRGGHTFRLSSQVFLKDCDKCNDYINGYGYICYRCSSMFHTYCYLNTPLLRTENHDHLLYSVLAENYKCRACGENIKNRSVCFKSSAPDSVTYFHFECALLPHKVSHRIHQHPLVIAPDLDTSVDDYICDACEKPLNPDLWVYRCSDICKDYATSHVSCIMTSKKKCHFSYKAECKGQTFVRIIPWV